VEQSNGDTLPKEEPLEDPVPKEQAMGEVEVNVANPLAHIDERYIRARKWPPKVTLSPLVGERLLCEKKNELPYDQQNKVTIGEYDGCLSVREDGAVGTFNKTTTFTTDTSDKRITIKWIISYTNCGAYDEEIMTVCEVDQKTFWETYRPESVIEDVFSELIPLL
jgi:hypothetical protein